MDGRFLVPPVQQFVHQAGHLFSRRGDVLAHTHMNGAISSRSALIHHVAGDDAMQSKNLLMSKWFFLRVLFHETQTSKIVHDLALRSRTRCWDIASLLDGADLFQGERIPFDSRGGVRI